MADLMPFNCYKLTNGRQSCVHFLAFILWRFSEIASLYKLTSTILSNAHSISCQWQ